MAILTFMPDWLLFTLLILLILVLYFAFVKDETTKKAIRRFFINYGIWIVALIVLIYGWNRWGTVAESDIGQMKYALFIVLLAGDLYMLASNFLYRERYNTIPFQADGVYGSVGLMYDLGDYTVFYLGTSGKSDFTGFVFPWFFAQRICVIPKNAWRYNGNAILSYIKVFKEVDIYIPEYVLNKIKSDGRTFLARDEIYYGELSNVILIEDQDRAELAKKLKDTQARLNVTNEGLKSSLIDFKDYASNTEATRERIQKGSSIMRRSPPQVTGEERY